MKLADGRDFDPANPQPVAAWNVYVCEGPDRHANLSVDLDEGVTPFMTRCVACGEPAQSRMYRAPGSLEAYAPAVMVWRKPTNGERKRELREQGRGGHYASGGLAKELTGEQPRLRMITARFA